eukprot:1313136-Prorocentrum_lima.AAC.1
MGHDVSSYIPLPDVEVDVALPPPLPHGCFFCEQAETAVLGSKASCLDEEGNKTIDKGGERG